VRKIKIPLFDPTRNKDELEKIKNVVLDVIDSGRYIGGEQVKKFEKEFASYIGVEECVGVNSGTDALIAACNLCNVKNKESIIPANTFVATSNATIYAGGIPKFVDADPEIYNIDTNLIENKITAKTKIILPVHLYGHPADIEKILEIARERHLFVIEDCAQAHGAKFKGKRVGSFGDVGCFSFYPSKNLGCLGDGGIVATNNKELAQKIRMFREYGQSKKYHHDVFGINTRIDSIQAAALRIKLKNLDEKNEKRRKLVEIYKETIEEANLLNHIKLPVEKSWAYHVYYIFVIRVPQKFRDPLINHLQENGVGAQIHYPIPIHKLKAYNHYSNESYPVTERLANEIISLPLFPELTDEEVFYVIEQIKNFFGRASI